MTQDPGNVRKIRTTQVPPADLDAEAVVLSAAILGGHEIVATLRELVEPKHFYADANKRVFEALIELTEDGAGIDTVSLARLLRARGQLDGIGGAPYLAQLTETTPATAHVEDHARSIRDFARKRAAIELGHRLVAEGRGDVGAAGDWLAAISRDVEALLEPGDREGAARNTPELPFLWVKELGELSRPPKLEWLFHDRRTGKPLLRAGKCFAICAAGGTGKGYTMLQTAVAVVTGRDLFETFTPQRTGPVALLVGEDDLPEIHHRLHRVTNALRLSDSRGITEHIGIFPLAGHQVSLLGRDAHRNPQRTAVFESVLQRLTKMAQEGGFEWSLIAIDPLSRFGGADVETDQSVATAFVAALEHLAGQLPGTPAVLVNHHSSEASSKSGRSNVRGVTGLRDAFRLVLTLDAFDGENGVRGVLLRNDKNNLAPKAPPLWLVRCENEPMGDGRYIEMAGVLRPATESERADLDAAAGFNATAAREQREQEQQGRKREAFEADCVAVLGLLPPEPAHVSMGSLEASLRSAGTPKSDKTLRTILNQLAVDGLATDLSGGSQSKPRQWARRVTK